MVRLDLGVSFDSGSGGFPMSSGPGCFTRSHGLEPGQDRRSGQHNVRNRPFSMNGRSNTALFKEVLLAVERS